MKKLEITPENPLLINLTESNIKDRLILSVLIKASLAIARNGERRGPAHYAILNHELIAILETNSFFQTEGTIYRTYRSDDDVLPIIGFCAGMEIQANKDIDHIRVGRIDSDQETYVKIQINN